MLRKDLGYENFSNGFDISFNARIQQTAVDTAFSPAFPSFLICLWGFNSKSLNPLNPDLKKKHLLADGKFRNNVIGPISKSFLELMKWRWNREAHKPLKYEMAENNPDFLKNNRSEPTLTWIGHSTLLLQYQGLNILTDPHMTKRASPVS